MNILDLCSMSAEMTRELNDIAEKSRRIYTESVDRLSEKYAENSNWWVTPFVSRDTSQCSAFKDYCLVRLAVNKLNTGEYNQIIVPNKMLFDAIKLNVQSFDVEIRVKESRSSLIKRKLSFLYEIYNIVKLYQRIHTVKKNSNGTNTEKISKRVILVDTYVIPSQFRGGEYVDRYFPGLVDNTDENIVFLAQLEFDNLKEGRILARNADRLSHVVLFEKYVRTKDFFEILKYIAASKKFSFENCFIDGIDILPVVRGALRQGASNMTAMYGILKGNVVCRLLDKYKLDIKKLIGWYEGQPSSNGMFHKFRKNNDNIPTIAYMYSPCPENNLGLYPSRMQRENKGVAKIYAVPGISWIDSVKQFDEKTENILAPSFRHGNILNKRIVYKKNNQRILVVLSGVAKVASWQLHIFFKSVKRLSGVQVYIKSHPFLENFKMQDYGISKTEYQDIEYEFISESIDELLENVKIAVVSETSSCLEIMVRGVSVIAFIPPGRLSYNCMPIEYKELVHVAYTAEDMQNMLISLRNEEMEITKLKELRYNAFRAVERENVRDFLKENR